MSIWRQFLFRQICDLIRKSRSVLRWRLRKNSKLIWCFCMYLPNRILPIQRLVQGQVDYWMQREKTPSERLPVWKSYCVLSIPSADAFRIGSPFEQILNEAVELKAGLIVMASHCYGWFDRLIHGSDAEAVLRQASLPSADGEGCLVGAVAFLILEAFIGFVSTLPAQTSRSGLVR